MYLQPPAILFPPLVPVNRIVFLDWIRYVTERPLTVTVRVKIVVRTRESINPKIC